jgi:hypothetical protein
MTDSLTPKYQFMVTDLLTNRILGQLPIEGASYTRAIRAAGSFSGTIKDPNMLAQSDIYHNTMPGRTGLYVLRNNVCVWGGIIWSREYDANEKSLSINGSEFTSYFHHRKLWRTFSTQVGGTLTVPTSGDASIQLELGSAYNFKEGQSVYLVFTDASLANLNGYFSILANPSSAFFYIDPAEKFYRLKSRKITKYDTANAVDASSATVEFKTATNHTFRKGDTITIKGSGNARMNGTRTIKSVPNSTTFTAQINAWANFRKEKNKTVSLAKAAYAALDGSIPPGTYSVTLDISVSTYDYVRKLIEAMALDFDGSVFPNSAIESGVNNVLDVETIACQEGYAILRTSTAHELSVGQKIVVRNVRGDLNGDFNVSNIIDDVTFEYFVGVNSFSETDISLKEYSLTKKRVINKTVTYTTDEAHTLTSGDYVTISGVPNETENYKIGKNNASIVHKYDGSYRVQVIPTTTTFQIDTNIVFKNSTTPIDKNLSGSGRVYSYPEVIVKTYGPFKENSDIGITFNDDDENLDITKIPASVRGFELVSLGEYLDTFTDSTGGFDYRIDCEYDAGINEFRRIFRVIPIDPPYEGLIDSTTKLQLLGADKVVFEYPGNISSVTMSESAENSANRFFLVGNKESLSGGEASQPYSAATFNGFSTTDFPLLDASASDDQSGDEDILYEGAYRYANESRPPLSDISININGSLLPAVGDYSPGDWCTIIINDPFIALRLASDTEERDDLLLRKINSFSVSINEGSTFPESVTLELVTEFGVDVGELS